jgi:hypothetical protein
MSVLESKMKPMKKEDKSNSGRKENYEDPD